MKDGAAAFGSGMEPAPQPIMAAPHTRVLVVEDSPTQREGLRFLLEDAGNVVITASDGGEALAVLAEQPVDLVISDIVMPGLDGYGLCAALRLDERFRDLPVILLTALADPLDVLRGLEAGADNFVRKPFRDEDPLARVGSVLATAKQRKIAAALDAGVIVRLRGVDHYLSQERLQFLDVLLSTFDSGLEVLPYAPTKSGVGIRVLVVEDSPTELARLQFALEDIGSQVIVAADGAEALAMARAGGIDMVVSDVVMPVMDGYALCRAIRADPGLRDLPVVLLTAMNDPNDAIDALESGATNFIRKPITDEHLSVRVRSLFAGYIGRSRGPLAQAINLEYDGRQFSITADRMQMLDLLVSSYDYTIRQNVELARAHDDMRRINEDLEARVASRTKALTEEIEERNRADARRDEAEAQLRAAQSLEAIGALAGGIAHDFNNLLSVIIGYTGMTLDAVPETNPMREDLLQVQQAAQRAAELTGQLLAFSRKQVLQPVPLDLNASARAVAAMLRRIIGEDIVITECLAPDVGLVLADPAQIEQVILNVAVNARDAMPTGGTLTIETANVDLATEFAGRAMSVAPGPYVMLAISDTGGGMDAATIDRVFEPFFTTKPKGRGTGLGLSSVHGIIRQSGGEIGLYSELGQGTTFKFYLPRETPVAPVAPVAPAPPAAKPSEDLRASSTGTTGTETILLVEDEDAVRNFCARILRAAGYTVLTASGAPSALALCKAHPSRINLLLTDVVMPLVSGPQLAGQVAKLLPGTRILFMSGYTDNAMAQHGLPQPAQAFISKPFTRAQLLAKVRQVLDG